MTTISSTKTAYLVSLKYAPGLLKEFTLLGENLDQDGWNIHYLLSSGYRWQLDENDPRFHFLTKSRNSHEMILEALTFPFSVVPTLRSLFAKEPPTFFCIYNPHPLNFVVSMLAQRANSQSIRSIYLHEPYKPDKTSFGPIGKFYYGLVEVSQSLTIRHTTDIIVPSLCANELFRLRYPKYQGAVHVAPILLPNAMAHSTSPPDQYRKYISLIGTLNQSRGVSEFSALINFAAEQDFSARFCIITRGDISSLLIALSDSGRNLLDIINKPQISDDEIAEVVAQSYAVFLPHRQVTQSGNVPVCFRMGTPIIARNLPGFSQHIDHKYNGYLVSSNVTAEDLYCACQYTIDNFTQLSDAALKSFHNVFSEHNWDNYYNWLPQLPVSEV